MSFTPPLAWVCSVYAIVLRYDVLLMTEGAAVGRTAEGKGVGAF